MKKSQIRVKKKGEKMKFYSDAQNLRQQRSDARNCIRVSLKFTKSTDADILEKLEEVENKQGYIKELIRKDLERSRNI